MATTTARIVVKNEIPNIIDLVKKKQIMIQKYQAVRVSQFFNLKLFGLKELFFWNSSLVHTDNKEKSILFFGEGLTQGLGKSSITAEAKYSISFTESGKRFILYLHYNGSNNFLLGNTPKIYQF